MTATMTRARRYAVREVYLNNAPSQWGVFPERVAEHWGRPALALCPERETAEEIVATLNARAEVRRRVELQAIAGKFIDGCEAGEVVGEVFFSQLLDRARKAIGRPARYVRPDRT